MSFKIKKTVSGVLCFMVFALISTGCGRDASLDEYKKAMETFYAKIVLVDEGMNVLNSENDPNGDKLLEYLDELNLIVSDMAEISVPEQFSSVESLGDEAAENMQKAVELYHQFYDQEEYNENLEAAAYEYYERANLRIRYIRDILHGELPDEYVADEDEADHSINFDDTGDVADPGAEEIPADESDGDEYTEEGAEEEVYYWDVEE